ncbi:MAG: tetratricopeptide repeat protein [Deltaproteobacteria bacterium]|nr:tetratricopeptide repeat protein [Deltaproteobacteria bacterium]
MKAMNAEMESKMVVITDFFHSEMEKIYLVIGHEEMTVYPFMDTSLSRATETEGNLVFRYEIWEGENSRHFLYRWLNETGSGQSFVGFGQWSEILNADPELENKLQLLIKKDIRPLEIRFMEAIRFISRKVTTGHRLILSIIPRTGMLDKVLVDFFKAMLRVLPISVKMLISQDKEDVLVKQSDFSPSNRVFLEEVSNEEVIKIRDRYMVYRQAENMKGRLVRILAHMVHPVDLGLLSEVSGETVDTLKNALGSDDLKDLIEHDAENRFRLTFPRMVPFSDKSSEDFTLMDEQAVECIKKRMLNTSDPYPDALYHSLGLSRLNDPDFIASQALSTYRTKMDIGGSDICEYEMNRALDMIGEKKDQRRADLLLTLGEIRESRTRNQEALEALNPAIEILKRIENRPDLQRALELKGRAAFSVREMDTAKAAFNESLDLTREMNQPELTADILSQLAYVHFSSQQLQEAENLYRDSLAQYQNLPEIDETTRERGEAAQWANLGHTFYAKGEFNKAEEYHHKALDIYESLGDQKAGANQWGYLGHTFFAAQDFDRANEAYEKAAELEEKMGQHRKAAQRHANVGHSMYAQRKVELASRSFQKALDKYKELGEPEGVASQLSNLGIVKGDQGEFDEAVGYFEQSALIYSELNDGINEATQIIKQGHVRRAEKQYGGAVKHYEDALNRFRTLKYTIGEGNTELDLGQLYSEKREWDTAVGYYHRAKEIFTKMGHREKESLCFVFIGHTERAREQIDAAIDAFKKAMELYKKEDNTLGVANVASQMGLLQYEQKNFGEAERLYRQALEVFQEKEDTEGETNLLSNLGTLYFNTGQLDPAREHFEKALSILRKVGHPLGIAGVLQNLSYVYEKEEKYTEAYDCLTEAKDLFDRLKMEREVEAIGQQLIRLDEKAGKSLENMRSELFPGLAGTEKKSGKKKEAKVGRNDPCPCGSGKKYKKCCGA